MRLTRFFGLAGLILAATAPVHAQVKAWEKRIAPGLIYRMEVDSSVPRIIHALRYSLGNSTVKPKSELGQGTVLAADDTKGRETITAMAKRTGAIAAINADFFPFTGDPLGLTVREGEILSTPYLGRSVFAWGDKEASTGFAEFKAELVVEGGSNLAITGLNESARSNAITLYSEKGGMIEADTPNFAVVIQTDTVPSPNGSISGEIDQTLKDVNKRKTEPRTLTLVATGDKIPQLRSLRAGDKVTLSLKTSGFDWSVYKNAVGGGPALLSDGRVKVDWESQGFKDTFAAQRHPRTAVGVTSDKDVWFVVVEGRQIDSDGATLEELGGIMQRLGCNEAINLDGGGSSQMALFGLGLVRPTDKTGERPVADGIVFSATAPKVDPAKFEFHGSASVSKGQSATYTVYANDRLVPNHDVIWSVRGPAWVDQGGTVHATGTGKITLIAYSRGHLLKTDLNGTVAPKKEATPVAPAATKPKKAPKSEIVMPKKAKAPAVSSENEVPPVKVTKPRTKTGTIKAAQTTSTKKVTKKKKKPVVEEDEEDQPVKKKSKKVKAKAKKVTEEEDTPPKKTKKVASKSKAKTPTKSSKPAKKVVKKKKPAPSEDEDN